MTTFILKTISFDKIIHEMYLEKIFSTTRNEKKNVALDLRNHSLNNRCKLKTRLSVIFSNKN